MAKFHVNNVLCAGLPASHSVHPCVFSLRSRDRKQHRRRLHRVPRREGSVEASWLSRREKPRSEDFNR